MARTDAIATHGLDEAIKRMQNFSEIGVDILFIEAVKSKEDMKKIMTEVPGNHMVNLIEDGDTPLLDINELEEIGYKIAVMPLTLMSASVKTMQECLKNMKNKKKRRRRRRQKRKQTKKIKKTRRRHKKRRRNLFSSDSRR